jgi:GrpB-like predicted nucleotidyltransferase (UPF0157 family)
VLPTRRKDATVTGSVEVLGRDGGDPIALVAHDPNWRELFSVWRRRLADALGDVAVSIEHVGSTAVPDLMAKPVIDLDVAVPDLADEVSYHPAIEGTGLILMLRDPEHRFFRPDVARGAVREVHVHVCEAGSRWQRDHLLFRDYLRAHPERRAAYAALKQDLAVTCRDDRTAYTDGKTDFVVETLALATRYLQPTASRIVR